MTGWLGRVAVSHERGRGGLGRVGSPWGGTGRAGGQWRLVRMDFRSLSTPGHVLSMPHDDSKPCARLFGPMGKHHMMAPLFVHLNKTLPWSPCSAMYLTELLDGGHGRCPQASPCFFLARCWCSRSAPPASRIARVLLAPVLFLAGLLRKASETFRVEQMSERSSSPSLPAMAG